MQLRPAEGAAVTERLTVPENELPPAIVMVDPAELPESVNTDVGSAVMAKSVAATTTTVRVRTEPR